MTSKVHSTAVIAKGAEIAPNAEIGPYSVIGPHVKIGAGTRVLSHVVIGGYTQIGRGCLIYPGTCLGLAPQDKKYKECRSHLVIGDDNVFREHVTIHLGSAPGARTVVGDRNMFMVGAHIAHDCVVGNDVVMVNGAVLAGFATVEDRVVMGGFSGIHQFTRVGRLSMVGGCAKVVMDVPPFSIVDGAPAAYCGINSVGLKRAGYSPTRCLPIKKTLKILLGSGLRLTTAVGRVRKEFNGNADIDMILSFCKTSKRGVIRARTEVAGRVVV